MSKAPTRKLNLFKKIALAVFTIVYLIITIGILTTKQIDGSGITFIKGHFDLIKANLPNRGSLNYDLYLKGSNSSYKIGANYADCFAYDDFQNQIHENDPIIVGIKSRNNIFIESSSVALVVSLKLNGVEYMNRNCINDDIQTTKYWEPPIGLLIIYFFYLVLKYKKTDWR